MITKQIAINGDLYNIVTDTLTPTRWMAWVENDISEIGHGETEDQAIYNLEKILEHKPPHRWRKLK